MDFNLTELRSTDLDTLINRYANNYLAQPVPKCIVYSALGLTCNKEKANFYVRKLRGFVGSLKNAFETVPSLSTKSRLPFKTLGENHASNDVSSAPYHVTLLFRRASPQETDSGSEHEYRDAFDIRRAG